MPENKKKNKAVHARDKPAGKKLHLPAVDLKFILMHLPYVIFGYVCNRMAYVYNYGERAGQDGLMYFLGHNEMIFSSYLPSFNTKDLLFGLAGGAAFWGVVTYKKKNAKKYRHGEEFGSARWGKPEDIEPYTNPVFKDNVLLTQTERITIGKASKPKYARNLNVLIIGGSGSGKTRFFIKPNIMQMHSSYVVTDPKGTVAIECGKMLKDHGYRIKFLNTIDFDQSNHYNPFAYIHNEKDILSLVNTIMNNTNGDGGAKQNEDFWVKAERLLLCAYIGAIFYFCIEEEQNFITLLDMIDLSETREDKEDFKNTIDLMFEAFAKEDSRNFAVKQYKKYKLAAGKTAKSILISVGARLAAFDVDALREVTRYDDLKLDELGDRYTALFVIISDTDDTFNFLVSIMYTQMFNLLCDKALKVYNGRLKVPVRCLLDEFANIGQIPKFDKLIATIRSRGISASIVLQSKAQLKTIYKDSADTIEGNCDSMVFLGGTESTTIKDLNEMLGKETIDMMNTSDTRGQSQSYGINNQKTGHELMSKDELAVMDGGKCICRVRGLRPFYSDKFDITKHRHYAELSDDHPENAFDVEKYIKECERKRAGSRTAAKNQQTMTQDDRDVTFDINDERYADTAVYKQ